MDNDVSVRVVSKRALIDGEIVELQLGGVAGAPLAPWTPGSHIDVVLPSGLTRQYSLCGHPDDDTYTIAVRREAESRGGSIEIHDALTEGDELLIRGPRNHFELVPAEHVVFIAGGIGITPLLPMMRQRHEAGQSWELHYGGKSLAALAYLDNLQLMEGHTINVYLKDETRRVPVPEVLGSIPNDSIVYVCGPGSMIDEVEQECALRGIAVRLERFGPSGALVLPEENTAFDVTLNRSGVTLRVETNQRLIDVVREVVPTVPFSCEEGYCGSCETGVLDGIPEHRDSILSPEEREANDCMMICVGRARTPNLLLDI